MPRRSEHQVDPERARELGIRVKQLRDSLNLSQWDVARLARVGRSWLSLIETGKLNDPSPQKLARLASTLGVDQNLFLNILGMPPLRKLSELEEEMSPLAVQTAQMVNEQPPDVQQRLLEYIQTGIRLLRPQRAITNEDSDDNNEEGNNGGNYSPPMPDNSFQGLAIPA